MTIPGSPLSDGSVRDHGGGVDAAMARWGGQRDGWLDLSTGINPRPYPLPPLPNDSWTALPDRDAENRLIDAARRFWNVPDSAGILAVPGASAAIARIPALAPIGKVSIPGPTYNEHAAAFAVAGWQSACGGTDADATVLVHPNNPDGRLWTTDDMPDGGLLVIDESFCDVVPVASLLPNALTRPDTLVLKSFGKFWGLAGLRLGFVIGRPALTDRLRDLIGPWAVSGPALAIGAIALADTAWAEATRRRLTEDAARLDRLFARHNTAAPAGTNLFRLYSVGNAERFQDRLGGAQILTRRFPYSRDWLRVGLPSSAADWVRLEAALA